LPARALRAASRVSGSCKLVKVSSRGKSPGLLGGKSSGLEAVKGSPSLGESLLPEPVEVL